MVGVLQVAADRADLQQPVHQVPRLHAVSCLGVHGDRDRHRPGHPPGRGEHLLPRRALPVGVAEHRRDRGYLQTLTAPAKHLEWFEHFGHNPCYEEPDRFNTFITGTVLAEAPAGQKQRL